MRSMSLALPCRFQDKGAPGRPRKRPRHEQHDRQLATRERERGEPRQLPPHSFQISPALAHEPIEDKDVESMLLSDDFSSFPFELSGSCGLGACALDFTGNLDFSSFPIGPLSNSHAGGEHEHPEAVSEMSLPSCISPPLSPQSCQCDEEVSDAVRALTRAPASHSLIQNLRDGIGLTEKLLTCPVCYDVSKPPRITVQNVLLIGRLMFEVTSGYQRYLRWLKTHCQELEEKSSSETLYLIPSLGIGAELGLKISGQKFHDVITHGLHADTDRMEAVGKQFAQRQKNRHLIGHETCPDEEGRCRREEYGLDHDPLDLCPHNAASRRLTPCFRIVDEVRAMIQQVAEGLD
ncbi:transcriptional regulator family: Fungal Specific TF [Penicillium argentinense]|uniref:Transcriptional regulator family: Fungal Specific TF n=1 Tax=Penicillium argentinense TaxID=1131581 RepID=A0A9W9G5X4_9EURO|nr:transcriptional regulator family: Fungal Specific TF [Penicillium argentinense]KAJ5112779.1 transcriptional regulator family: Fungal Specific TF [Penicillium argentinense]